VFDSGDGPVAVLWAGETTEVSVRVAGDVAVTDLMGRTHDVDVAKGRATVTVGPDPVYLSAGRFKKLTDTPKPAAMAAPITAADFSAADRVVIQPVFDETASKNAQLYGYGLPTDAPTPMTAEVYNFGASEVTTTVTAQADGGWAASGGPATVTVPAGGKVDVPFELSAGPDLRQSIADLTLVADVEGEQSSPAVVELRPRAAVLTGAHVVDGVDDVVRVTYTNATDAAQHLSAAAWTFDGDTSTTRESVDVAPGATVTLDSTPAPAGAGEVAYEAAVTIDDIGTVTTKGTISSLARRGVPVVAEQAIVVDGARDDLAAAPAQHLAAPGVDPDSLAATAWFTWDADHLYLTAEVHDDIHTQPFTGNATWKSDGLQFAVAPNWPGETDLRPEIQPRIEFGFALTPEGPQLYRYASGAVGGFLTDADVAAVRDDSTGVTVYEAAVPWSLLAPIGVTPSSAASLSIVANDSDGDGTRGWVQWGGGITTAKDSELFEPVIFGGAALAAPGSSEVPARCEGAAPRVGASEWNDADALENAGSVACE
jgi:hypothetical protein